MKMKKKSFFRLNQVTKFIKLFLKNMKLKWCTIQNILKLAFWELNDKNTLLMIEKFSNLAQKMPIYESILNMETNENNQIQFP